MKVLLATDGGKHSQAAVEAIRILNPETLTELKIISVIDMSVPLAIDIYAGYLPSTAEIEAAAKETAENILKEASQKVSEMLGNKPVKITTEILVGSPESAIVETAEQMPADLIIVGSHSYNRWERLLLGSVSDSVVHHAHCSVLIVKSQAG
ncbi:MAG: universal stress protein [Acidobacteria bacterium]|jgi:nucleotide-binding universal stress UspA family protein|nr:MAG: universal stress protein [Acidobacteriota bacterium]GIU81136.1 MAG: universal stress protein [Pyrinomonadaceae bacterium]